MQCKGKSALTVLQRFPERYDSQNVTIPRNEIPRKILKKCFGKGLITSISTIVWLIYVSEN